MADNEDGLTAAIKGIGALVLLGVVVVSSLVSEKNKEKHSLYKGTIDGQQVRYMEYTNRNEMEIKGKRGTYTLTDSVGFHRICDPSYTTDTLEKAVWECGREKIEFARENKDFSGFEGEISSNVFVGFERFYRDVRILAKEKGSLKLEADEGDLRSKENNSDGKVRIILK